MTRNRTEPTPSARLASASLAPAQSLPTWARASGRKPTQRPDNTIAADPPRTGDGRRLLKVSEAADRLAVSQKTIRRLLCTGSLKAVRIGRSVRIAEADIYSIIGKE